MNNDRAYIDQVLFCISKNNQYTNGVGKDKFKNEELIQDAVIRNNDAIGETTKRISKLTKQNYSEIPWKEIAGMRDKLIHDYLGVDIEVVWKLSNWICLNWNACLKLINDSLTFSRMWNFKFKKLNTYEIVPKRIVV